MEGDAGASRLNPADTEGTLSPEETVEDPRGSETGADQISPEETVEDPEGFETGADQISPEETVEDPHESTAAEPSILAGSRLDRRWLAGIGAALLLISAGAGMAGFLGFHYHRLGERTARDNAEAVAAAKDCVLAIQLPDVADPTAAATKIFDCATGQFQVQAGAGFYAQAEMFVQAYQASQAHVQISEVRAAVERTNNDGSVDVLVAFRGTVDNVEVKGREIQFRLRAQMARDNGQYRVAKLDQVAK